MSSCELILILAVGDKDIGIKPSKESNTICQKKRKRILHDHTST